MKVNNILIIFKDKDDQGTTKWSFGRILLSVAVGFFFMILTKVLFQVTNPDINLEAYKVIIEGIIWFIGVLLVYVFGDKVKGIISAFKEEEKNNLINE